VKAIDRLTFRRPHLKSLLIVSLKEALDFVGFNNLEQLHQICSINTQLNEKVPKRVYARAIFRGQRLD